MANGPVEVNVQPEGDEETAQDMFKVYEEYGKTLRTWFVAYGIGGPVFVLNNQKVLDAITAKGLGRRIAIYFLGGVAAQVVLAMLNKNVMWVLFYSHMQGSVGHCWHSIADWFSRQYWIDALLDIGTFVLFSIATWLIFDAAVK